MDLSLRPSAENVDFFGALKKIAEAAIVIAAFLFIAGWSYLYGYFSAFGLRAGDLNFPVQTVLMYAVPIVSAKWLTITVVLATIIAANLVGQFRPGLWRRAGHVIAQPVIVLAVAIAAGLFLSQFGASFGRKSAHRDVVLETSLLPSVQLMSVAKVDSLDVGCELEGWYKLLLHANEAYYIFKALDVSSSANSVRQLKVCIVPDSQVRSVRAQVGVSAQ